MPSDLPEDKKKNAVQDQPNVEAWRDTFRDYRAISPYHFLDDAYSGTGGFSGRTADDGRRFYSFLTPNPTERFYLTRVRTSVYTNHLKKIVNARINPVFGQKQVVTTVTDSSGRAIKNHPYEEFLNNVNGAGTGKNELIRVALALGYLHGASFIVMDKFADAVQPFVYVMRADDVEEYTTDRAGGLSSIAFKDGEEGEGEKEVEYIVRYTNAQITREKRLKGADSWTVTDTKPNSIGAIPVLPVFGQIRIDSRDYLPFPEMFAVGQICHWIYDKESNLDWLIQKQAHDIIVINGTVEGIGRPTDNALIIPASDQKLWQPFALSPDAEKARVHQERIDKKLQDLSDLVSQNGIVAQQTSVQASSGVSKAYSFIATNDALKATATLAKNIEAWLEKFYKLFTGSADSWTIATDYPSDFQPRPTATLQDALDSAAAFQKAGLLLNWRESMKAVVYVQNATANATELQPQIDEIEASDLPGSVG